MKIGICFNPYRADERCFSVINKFKSLLSERKIEYFFLDESNEKPDLIAVFGGDGTILSKSKYATENEIPILAVNVGTVGFLSSIEEKDLDLAVNMLTQDSFSVKERTAISIITPDGEVFYALNDAVIERDKRFDGASVVAKLDFSIDGNLIYKLSADGIIISTPTGSTAYSLSAGGVILTPDLHSFIATPICSHSLYTRPIVYNDDSIVKVKLSKNSSSATLSVDGKCVKQLNVGDEVTISKHPQKLKIIDCGEEFFNRLIKKLGK